MTKQEKILKQQVKELERLIEIKDAVIVELKSLITPNHYWPTYYLPNNYWPTSTGSTASTTSDNITITGASGGSNQISANTTDLTK